MTGWIYQRKKELKIYGPAGTRNLIKNIKAAFVEDIKIRTVPPENHDIQGLNSKTFEINEGVIYKNNDTVVTAFRVDHGGGVEHAFGYKITHKEKVVIISGDTNYSENLIKYARNCDLLIHEIADAPLKLIQNNSKVSGLMNYHTTPAEMSRIISKVKPKHTVLTHVLALGGISEKEILHKVQGSVDSKFVIELAYDLMAIDVKDNIRSYSIDYTYD